MLRDPLAYRHREAAANYVSEDVVDHVVELELIEDPLLLQELDGRSDAAARAAHPRRRPARLDAVDAVVAAEDRVMGVDG